MMSRRRASALVLISSLAVALSACGSSTSTGAGTGALDLQGRTFVGSDVAVDDQPDPLVKGSAITLTFDNASITSSAGCNTMSGSAAWDDAVLAVDDGGLAVTEMGCAAPLMRQDTWWADILTAAPTLELNGSTLTLTNEGTIIHLTDSKELTPDASLTGTDWQLESILDGGAVSSVPGGAKATLRFGEDGQLSAFLGCNSASGPYTAKADVLSIGPLASTLMACSPPAADIESAMGGLLGGDVTYSINGDALLLSAQEVKGSGVTAMSFRAS